MQQRISTMLVLVVAGVIILGLLVWLVLAGARDSAPAKQTAPTLKASASGGQPASPTLAITMATTRPETVTVTVAPATVMGTTPETASLLPTPTRAQAGPPTPAITAQADTGLVTPAVTPGVGERPVLLPLSPEPPITHGDRAAPLIALTFDACQDPDLPAGYDADLIRVLLDTNTPATLFLGGDWMRTHPEETRYLAEQPLFELGNHGWAHIDFAASAIEEMIPEIEQTQDIMWELVGRQPAVFRFPGGTYTREALSVAAELGVRPIEWEVVSGDPDPDITAERMIPWVVNQVQNGSIIIMHMNGRGWHTAEALPAIIAQLREQGFRFVTVSQLLDVAPTPVSVSSTPDGD